MSRTTLAAQVEALRRRVKTLVRERTRSRRAEASLRESEALVRRQEIDLANLAQLSQYIVQHLRESILVIDAQDRIRLINESAAEMLGDQNAYPDALIGEACPRLLFLLESWRQGSGVSATLPAVDPTFVAADGARVIRAHFAPLGSGNPGPLLIFLEDTSLLGEKVQQSKLAALGRLSASIAHEIRNPVGAMSHAGQLLAESPRLAEEDRRWIVTGKSGETLTIELEETFSDSSFELGTDPGLVKDGVEWVKTNGPTGTMMEQGRPNGHEVEVAPLKRILLRTMPELAPVTRATSSLKS